MNKLFLITILFVFSLFQVEAQEQMERLRHGRLDNGLTYYIKHSDLQKGQASFYLLQDVGAILEENNENGLAHFLEHMAFNGSEHFPEGVMSYLKGKGLYTFNASTGINETVYNIDDVPVKDAGFMDSCLLILRDWCNGVLLKDADINAERGVIIEEWRGRGGVDRRLEEASAPFIYNRSKYADRNIIGTLESLRSFSTDVLRNFYHTWYRPNLQCVIIVGDIDEVEYEGKIKQLLGQIPVATQLPERYSIQIDDNASPLYHKFVDPENKTKTITFYQRIPKVKHAGEMARRKFSMSVKVLNSVLKERIRRLKNDNQEAFLAAEVNFDGFVREYNALTMDIIPLENKDRAAFEQLWTLWEEIRRFGISEDEFTQQQELIYQQLKEFERNLDKNQNNYYIDVFKNNYLNDIPMVDISEEISLSKEIILELEADDIKTWVDSWANNRNIVMIVAGNDPKYAYLEEKELNEILETVSKKELKQVKREKREINFFDLTPPSGTITKIKPLKKFDAEEWTLSNGAKVIYKYVEEGRETFGFACSSKGGRSVVDAKDLPSLTAMEALVLKSGIYKHDRNAIRDFVTGKEMNVNFFINEWTEGIGGNSLTENAETFFQLIWLMFEKPRFQKDVFDKYVQQSKFLYETTKKSPLEIVGDSIQWLTTEHSDRNREMDISYINEMDFNRIENLYRARFSNAKEFTFCIVGDIEKEEAERLSTRYIASLPSVSAKKEQYLLHDYSKKAVDIEKVYEVELSDNKAIVDISFVNNLKLSDKEQLAFSILGTILQNRYFEQIREEQGGTYGVNVGARHLMFPKTEQTLSVNFETEMTKAVDLKNMVYAEFERMQESVCKPQELSQVVISLKRNKEQADERMDVAYWMNVLNYYVEYGEDITSTAHFEDIIDKITVEDIRKVAQKFFKQAKHRDILVKSL
ncbi:MAG: insulinase family protein [Odoribacter sp.]